jgi:hypothetical protein
MLRKICLASLLWLSIPTATCLAAQTPADVIGSIAVPITTVAPPIDGALMDPAWKHATMVALPYDLRNHGPAPEPTTVYIMSDAQFVYVGVDAKQSIGVRATEHTNGVGLDTDDEFQVDLWPNGTSGFMYKFTSTPIGTRYQFSTENNLFEPEWLAAGKIVPGGYTLTMRIPLGVMHGTGSQSWRVQFIRYVAVTNDQLIWSYGASQQGFNDVNYSGSLTGLPRLGAMRGRPRVGVYALGSLASKSIGGPTSRVGADFSVPVIPGTALVGTLHPDFSDVEVDQQTIAPTAFPRFFQEVRPFFAQGGNFLGYPDGNCIGCPGIFELYTPRVPTPSAGLALEGRRGLFNYAGYETRLPGRSDGAQEINYVSPNQQNFLDVLHTSVHLDGLSDSAIGFNFKHDNLTNFQEDLRYASDAGTNVATGNRAQRYEAGLVYYSPTGNISGVIRKVGPYFDPVEGLVQHPDIAGYALTFFKQFRNSPQAPITEIDINGNFDRYHDHTGALDQTDNGLSASITTRRLFNLQLSTGSSYLLICPGSFVNAGNLTTSCAAGIQPVFTPITQQGLQLGYNLNGAMPSFVGFNTGRFGPGLLNSWTRSSTMRLGERGLLTLEADNTSQYTDAGQRYTQWLERASIGYQPGKSSSFALGVRRVIGISPALELLSTKTDCRNVLDPRPCYADVAFASGWNLSAAYHRKMLNGELYFAYGDAARFSTVPQFIVKFIRYIGAEKGT